jgi:hypothetical protein
MQAERFILETDAVGMLKHVPPLPPNKQVEITFAVVGDSPTSGTPRRTPHPDIAAKGKILGNIFDSVPPADWNLSE